VNRRYVQKAAIRGSRAVKSKLGC